MSGSEERRAPVTALMLQVPAVEYARSWFTRERRMVRGLASGSPSERLKALCDAAGYFRIARNMPLTHDLKRGLSRLQPALDVLDGLPGGRLDDDTLVEVVCECGRRLAAAYGQADLLSAASKFLWLMHRDVVIIIDSQARTALGTAPGDYAGYVERWRETRERHGEALTQCSEWLATNASALGLEELASQDPSGSVFTDEWFRRRILDIYLWQVGALRPS